MHSHTFISRHTYIQNESSCLGLAKTRQDCSKINLKSSEFHSHRCVHLTQNNIRIHERGEMSLSIRRNRTQNTCHRFRVDMHITLLRKTRKTFLFSWLTSVERNPVCGSVTYIQDKYFFISEVVNLIWVFCCRLERFMRILSICKSGKCKTLPEGVEESKTTLLRGLNKARKHRGTRNSAVYVG